ncbi:hypothetical protein Pla52n_47540 [Stieleria varia]|uniref:Uncharacterized protein n=1 Tax=Stieleria varia TaxID=2528005 RepID=A0A5C6AE44_9BACT|nr:hypothetical protein Pla52n_47540 [Stieleria varia]
MHPTSVVVRKGVGSAGIVMLGSGPAKSARKSTASCPRITLMTPKMTNDAFFMGGKLADFVPSGSDISRSDVPLASF